MPNTVKYLTISAKCSDLCWVSAEDENHKSIAEGDGYVPDFMPGDHYGDYVMLTIDAKTGKIVDWPKLSDSQILRDIKGM